MGHCIVGAVFFVAEAACVVESVKAALAQPEIRAAGERVERSAMSNTFKPCFFHGSAMIYPFSD